VSLPCHATSVVYLSLAALMRVPEIVLALFMGVCGCSVEGGPTGPPAFKSYHVLFIGNSLTEVNDLPAVFKQLVATAGDSVEVAAVVRGGFALVDHAAGLSDARQVIASRHWDYVVLQQGPSTLPISRDTLIVGTKLLDALIQAAGARTAELMVWPDKGNIGAFDQVRDSYQAAAQAVNGLFLPAGEAWRAAWAVDPSLPLYGPDDFHPSELGTYLAALVVFEGITTRDAQKLPPEAVAAGHLLNVSEGTVRLLQRIAHETVVRFAGGQ
jgi:hypothetical protein